MFLVVNRCLHTVSMRLDARVTASLGSLYSAAWAACHAATTSSIDLYLRLRDRNPAPYAGYLDLGEMQICSDSPECFLTVRDRTVETRPIKGTRQ